MVLNINVVELTICYYLFSSTLSMLPYKCMPIASSSFLLFSNFLYVKDILIIGKNIYVDVYGQLNQTHKSSFPVFYCCSTVKKFNCHFARQKQLVPYMLGIARIYIFCRQTPINGFADDYSFFIKSLLDTYESCYQDRLLQWAEELQDKQNSLFWDTEGAGYFTSGVDDDSIIYRLKEGRSASCILLFICLFFKSIHM